MKTLLLSGLAGLSLCLAAGTAAAADLTIYSGRGEAFVAPVIEMFETESGLDVEVRYAGTAELAALLQEEGAKSPADLFWAQDGGALGATDKLFAKMPAHVGQNQPEHFKSADGKWIGTSARARVIVHSPERAPADTLPKSVLGLTDAAWKGRVGWAPSNGSFQSFVTALRVKEGEEAAKAWVDGMVANGAKAYRNNVALVQAIADGEIDAALTNNYYLGRFKGRDDKFPVEQRFFADGDIGNLLNVAGVGILETSDSKEAAERFAAFLLTPAVQQYFTSSGNEYPVIKGVIPNATLASVATVETAAPNVPLDQLSDLPGTLELLRSANLL
ncbi:iron ABC transporter substrate-binding protein [Aureimonas sp. AU40]|uniref:iron ABC transporter substrate-binding protein n=1 Tax=Aureimonas sp. AU40 TaxID=1637747 RepID=UPI0007816567|nr:iron ABC transporter substrate-binding protein [Aureimonas sp. AU40]